MPLLQCESLITHALKHKIFVTAKRPDCLAYFSAVKQISSDQKSDIFQAKLLPIPTWRLQLLIISIRPDQDLISDVFILLKIAPNSLTWLCICVFHCGGPLPFLIRLQHDYLNRPGGMAGDIKCTIQLLTYKGCLGHNTNQSRLTLEIISTFNIRYQRQVYSKLEPLLPLRWNNKRSNHPRVTSSDLLVWPFVPLQLTFVLSGSRIFLLQLTI